MNISDISHNISNVSNYSSSLSIIDSAMEQSSSYNKDLFKSIAEPTPKSEINTTVLETSEFKVSTSNTSLTVGETSSLYTAVEHEYSFNTTEQNTETTKNKVTSEYITITNIENNTDSYNMTNEINSDSLNTSLFTDSATQTSVNITLQSNYSRSVLGSITSADRSEYIFTSNITNEIKLSTTSNRPRFRIAPYVWTSKCSAGASELAVTLKSGYKNDGRARNADDVSNAVNQIKSALENSPNDFTEFKQAGEIKCALWSGAMLNNKDLGSYFIWLIDGKMRRDSVQAAKFYEHIGKTDDKPDPMKTFGVVCVGNDNNSIFERTIRAWSRGQSASSLDGIWDGYADEPDDSQCFLEYDNRKTNNMYNDPNYAECEYKLISKGEAAASLCGINGESVGYYNRDLNLNNLRPGDAICCSIGNRPNLGYSQSCDSGHDRVGRSIVLGWRYKGSYYNKDVTKDVVNLIKDGYNSGSNELTQFKSQNGVQCAAYFGAMVSNSDTTRTFLDYFNVNIEKEGMPNVKYIEATVNDDNSNNALTTVGVICAINEDKGILQRAIKTWSKGMSFGEHDDISVKPGTSVCYLNYNERKKGNLYSDPNIGQCDYKRISNGQSASDACDGTTGDVLQYYNPGRDFTKLSVNAPVCCTLGDMPDFRPKKNNDGSCFVHQFSEGEGCGAILAQYYPLSEDDLMKYNKDTFNWLGCSNGHPWKDDKICLSDGTPPRPAVNPLAECGPQAPGDKYNAKCPLNACCSQYGFCGYGDEFCDVKDSLTGAPGTTGCMSNCGKGGFMSPIGQRRIAYYMGTDVGSAKKIDILSLNDKYDIIHLAFGDIAQDHNSLNVNNIKDAYNLFKSSTAKKVLSFGGWDFSTDQATYQIFRNAIGNDPEGFANTVANFMNDPDNSWLDGIDFDWEYPGAPDIPGIPADNSNNGNQLYKFLRKLKELLGNSKTVSLAIPSSFWYLKPYPIKDIMDTVDYAVMMTYDLYGQWTYDQKWSGGPNVRCHVDLPETKNSLNLIAKTGANLNKIFLGVANYGRSYQLADPNCRTIGCKFTGPQSGAKGGKYLNVPGILSFDEINDIRGSDRVNNFDFDGEASCFYMRYDNDQWVAWENADARNDYYASLGFAGTSLWAGNYETDNLPGAGTNTPDSDDDEDDSAYYDDNYVDPDYNGEVFVVRISKNYDCYNRYKNIRTEKELNKTDSNCAMEANIAYLLNHADDSINKLEQCLPGNELRKDYKKAFDGYKSYFAHLMSYTYQEWALTKYRNEGWFTCLDKNANKVSCVEQLDYGVSSSQKTCEDDCCPDSGCYKTSKDFVDMSDIANKCSKNQRYVNNNCCFSRDINGNIVDPNLNKRDYNTFNPDADIINTNYLLGIGYDFGYNPVDLYPLYANLRFKAGATVYGMKPASDEAYADFSETTGYNLKSEHMYVQPFYRTQRILSNDKKQICYEDIHGNVTFRCVSLPSDQMFVSDPMVNITQSVVNEYRNFINTMRVAIENNDDYMINLYYTMLETLSVIIDTEEAVSAILIIGDDYNSRCSKLRILKLLKPLLDILSIISIFLGPWIGTTLEVLSSVLNLTMNPDLDAADIVGSVLGILAGPLGAIKGITKGRFLDAAIKDSGKLNKVSRTLKLMQSRKGKSFCSI